MKKNIDSDISDFYKFSVGERQKRLDDFFEFSEEEKAILQNFGYFKEEELNKLIENVIGTFEMPMGVACHFKVNKKDYLIPMAIEEPSVIAAASKAAKIARKHGGFQSSEIKSVMIAQVQLTDIDDEIEVIETLWNHKKKILEIANEKDPKLNELGGGAFDFKIRELTTRRGKMVIIHLLVDVLDAMGANVVNTMAEAIAPYIEKITGGKVYLRIVSNLCMHRIAESRAVFDKDLLGGEEVVDGILSAYDFALADPYRAATHNKGIMNGISALTLATGNDTRAIEAGAHAYASLKGIYSPLTNYYKNKDGHLVGKIEIPLALGVIGGMTNTHPMVRIALKILNVKSGQELTQVAAALGLAQNLAALRALATEGIQQGHMVLHKRKFKESGSS
ncbi:MAG: hydroxymethylglutaryl-CoA reductase, degradative [Promethearchaeia archaeon]